MQHYSTTGIYRRGHATQAILTLSKLHTVTIFRHSTWVECLTFAHYWILFIVYPASDMKFGRVDVSLMPSSYKHT